MFHYSDQILIKHMHSQQPSKVHIFLIKTDKHTKKRFHDFKKIMNGAFRCLIWALEGHVLIFLFFCTPPASCRTSLSKHCSHQISPLRDLNSTFNEIAGIILLCNGATWWELLSVFDLSTAHMLDPQEHEKLYIGCIWHCTCCKCCKWKNDGYTIETHSIAGALFLILDLFEFIESYFRTSWCGVQQEATMMSLGGANSTYLTC